MKAACAWRSCFDHLAYQSKSAFVPDIIRMYFMSFAPFDSRTGLGALSWCSRNRYGVLYISQVFLDGCAQECFLREVGPTAACVNRAIPQALQQLSNGQRPI